MEKKGEYTEEVKGSIFIAYVSRETVLSTRNGQCSSTRALSYMTEIDV